MPETLAVLIANTNVRHDLADGAYTQRRQTCAAAAAALGIPSLRDVKPGLLSTLDGEQHRCTRHVIGENQRTRLAAAALVTGDLDTLGELMFDSHASLRDLYRVSCPELDTLVDAAAAFRGKSGVIGARMTGAGFGGCAVVLCRTDRVEDVSCGIRGRFAKRFAREADCFTTAAAGPAESLAP